MSTITNLDAISMLVGGVRGSGQRRPLIGVTAGTRTLESGAWQGSEASVLNRAYTDAITAAGGRPVIVTVGEEWTAAELADLDALVITGGTDLSPELYGGEACATDFAPDAERDAFECALVRCAARLGLSLLGICRGLQVINVALGGSLVQHLPDSEFASEYPETAAQLTEVPVEISADSDLGLALGTGARVSAYHHQAVDNLAPGFRVIARHTSGVIHAIQNVAAQRGFILGVQFHPEVTEGAQSLFDVLVAHALSRTGVPAQQ